MRVQEINLINPDKGSIKYHIVEFPDSEKHIVIDSEIDHKKHTLIITRIANADDLFILMQLGDILNRHGVTFSLYITYLMGMRMDRVVAFNEAFSLKLVADAINSIKPIRVTLVEAHSQKAVSLINNCDCQYVNVAFVATADYYCFPDAGAIERYAHQFSHSPERPSDKIILCSKERDPETGKLSGFKILNPEVYKGGSICVVDDLCDGGGTFAGVAEKLREIAPDAFLKVYVTHMVNPKGIITLAEHFDEVEFSDSYADWNLTDLPDNVKCSKNWSK